MVAIALLQVSALMAGGAFLFDRIARPRLPVYNLEMVGLPLPKRSARTNEWKIALTTDVDMFNANFVHIDVHALSFDMFYASSTGAETGEQILRHIGNVQDLQQHEKKPPSASPSAEEPKEIVKKPRRKLFKRGGSANNNSTEEAPPPPAIWSIESRSNFTTTSSMLLSVNFGDLVRSLYQLLCRWWQNSGRLTVPMTGVAHIRAVTQYSKDDGGGGNSAEKSGKGTTATAVKSSHPLALKLPFTVSIICDNLIDTWRWQVKITGVECAMHNMASGWTDLETATAAVREFALNRLPVNATGGVLNHPTMSWEQVLETIAWEESLQHP